MSSSRASAACTPRVLVQLVAMLCLKCVLASSPAAVASVNIELGGQVTVSAGGVLRVGGSDAVSTVSLPSPSPPSWPPPSPPPPPLILSLGSLHSCAYLTDHTLKCWGYNYYGQVGDGTNTQRNRPTTIEIGGPVAGLALGVWHSCAALVNGELKCWGRNSDGELGDGTTTNRNMPITIDVGGAVEHVALGADYTCASLAGGALKCWGKNNKGQLGDGTTTARSIPTAVDVGGAVERLALGSHAGYSHTCASLVGGSLRCWGSGAYGELGDGTGSDRYTPTTIDIGDAAVERLALGYSTTCVSIVGGALKCWGKNDYGQLGDGTTTNSHTPTTIDVDGAVEHLALGADFTCAALATGALKCWGRNHVGQLGDGTTSDRRTPGTAIEVGGAIDLVALAQRAHGGSACAHIAGGVLKCWGKNGYGQLGDGTTTDRSRPTTIDGA